jgi:oligopeptidase A
MTYAHDRPLRAELHRAFATRASELGANPEWDNTPIIARILELRREAAELLGYPDFATLALVPRMARGTGEVMDFLHDLACHAKPIAEREYAELSAFARNALGLERLEAWDLLYAAEQLKERLHAFSSEEVRAISPRTACWPASSACKGGITIREAKRAPWHPDVRFSSSSIVPERSSDSSISTSMRVRQAGRRGWTTRSTAAASGPACSPVAYPRAISGPVGEAPRAGPRRSRTTR